MEVQSEGDADMTVESVTVSLSPSTVSSQGQTTVTATLQPTASGHSVSLQVRESPNSGGHSHSGRPLGSFAASSGATDPSGQFTTTYTASLFGGGEIITATIDGISDSRTLNVAVLGLSSLGSGSNYSLVGATITHPINHHGTATANTNLVAIANQYAATYPGSTLRYNDQSLPQGGLFDINANWATPHAEHRFGTNCDVSKSNVPSDRWATLQTIFANNGSPNFLEEPDHWHLRF